MTTTNEMRDEIARRGEEIYEARLRQQVETEENIGKILSIDVDTGEYAIIEDLVVSARRLKDRHPNAAVWIRRIGYDAVYAVGGSSITNVKVRPPRRSWQEGSPRGNEPAVPPLQLAWRVRAPSGHGRV